MARSILDFERSQATFKVPSLTNLLDGGASHTFRRRAIEAAIVNDPTGVFDNGNNANLTRVSRHLRALKKHIRMLEVARSLGIPTDDVTNKDFVNLLSAVADDLPTLLHWGMFLPNLRCLFTESQLSHWLPLASTYAVVGCYAQTELGHGSNVRALETTATYDSSDDTFIINTPSLTARKFWPGSLGKTANTAIVICRLIIGSKDHGVHNFLVPIRDMDTHEPLPNVTVGDIGSKLGYNTMDNGYLSFDNVKIPRLNMAMRFSSVSSSGVYSKNSVSPSTAKFTYITMMQVRSQIVLFSSVSLATACTISIRYSAIRLQGFSASPPSEMAILDYVQQQHRLFHCLSSAYCFHFTGTYILSRLKMIEKRVLAGDDVSKTTMQDLHCSLSALKSFCSTVAAEGIEDCRKACGGHGYLDCSGFPELVNTYLQNPTVEGDNYMLPQQVAKVLLKLLENPDESLWADCDAGYLVSGVKRAMAGNIEECDDPTTVDSLLNILSSRAALVLVELGQSLNQARDAPKKVKFDAWNSSHVVIARLSKAHSAYMLMRNFIDAAQSDNSGSSGVLLDLALLFGLMEVERHAGDFLEHNLIDKDSLTSVRDAVLVSLKKIRGNAVALVDAFDFSDFRLKSALGEYSGKNVYEKIINKSEQDMMNTKEVMDVVVAGKRYTQSRL